MTPSFETGNGGAESAPEARNDARSPYLTAEQVAARLRCSRRSCEPSTGGNSVGPGIVAVLGYQGSGD